MKYTNRYGADIKLIKKGAVLSKTRGSSTEFNVIEIRDCTIYDIGEYENHTDRKVILKSIPLTKAEAITLRNALNKIIRS